jgi:uncharacterized phiE125 gp8 family phage protein
MSLVIDTEPAVEPVDLAEAKEHLRVDEPDDDSLITNLIVAARKYAEIVTSRALIDQVWLYTLDAFPAGEIHLPRPPLQDVTTFRYRLESGTWSSLVEGTDYVVDTSSEPGRVVLAPNATWPTDTLYPGGAVELEYPCGYGAAGTDVPGPIRQAMLLMIGHWYENRESVVVGQSTNIVPLSCDALLWPYRIWWVQP